MSDEDIFWDDGVPPVPSLQKGSKLFINDDERAGFDKANGVAYLALKRIITSPGKQGIEVLPALDHALAGHPVLPAFA